MVTTQLLIVLRLKKKQRKLRQEINKLIKYLQ